MPISPSSPRTSALCWRNLRILVRKGVPDAGVSIKWGVPCYSMDGRLICALAAFKEHVGLNYFAPPGVFVDPNKKLEGSGKTSRMLKFVAPPISTAPASRGGSRLWWRPRGDERPRSDPRE